MKNVKKKTTKGSTKKPTKSKERLTKKQIIMELRKKRDEIEVEIKNISSCNCGYQNRRGDIYFDLMPGETEIVSLEELGEVCSHSKSFFSDNLIVINEIYTDDISMEDVIMYLGLERIYKDIEFPSEDIFEELLTEYEDYELENVVNSKTVSFVKTLASKAKYMNDSDMYDYKMTRNQDKIISEKLGKRSLFELED